MAMSTTSNRITNRNAKIWLLIVYRNFHGRSKRKREGKRREGDKCCIIKAIITKFLQKNLMYLEYDGIWKIFSPRKWMSNAIFTRRSVIKTVNISSNSEKCLKWLKAKKKIWARREGKRRGRRCRPSSSKCPNWVVYIKRFMVNLAKWFS